MISSTLDHLDLFPLCVRGNPGRLDVCLVSHGVTTGARDSQERSSLHHAAKLGNLQAIKTLLALGIEEHLQAAAFWDGPYNDCGTPQIPSCAEVPCRARSSSAGESTIESGRSAPSGVQGKVIQRN